MSYRVLKVIRETLVAFTFLLPNFLGFLAITAFPMFFTIFLSFTRWNGTSMWEKAKGVVELKLQQPAQKRILIPAGTVLGAVAEKKIKIVINTEKDYKTTIPEPGNPLEIYGKIFSLSEQVDIPKGSSLILSFSDGQKNYQVEAVLEEDLNDLVEGETRSVKVKITELPEGLNPGMPISSISLKGNIPKRIEMDYVLERDLKVDIGETEGRAQVTAQLPGIIGNISEGAIFTVKRLPEGVEMPDIPKDALITNPRKFEGGQDGIKIVGIENFRYLIFKDKDFWRYFWNTVIFLLEIPLGMAVSLILALAMNQKIKGIVFFRTLYFMPVISNIVAIALLWKWIYAEIGPMNRLLMFLGVTNPPNWLGDPIWARISIIIMDVWKGAGYNMLLYLAALQQIPSYLYEAAEIDGANSLQQFWYVTWPLLAPANFFILIMGIIGGFQAFGSQYVLTGGGPAGATTTLVYYIYNNAFQWFKMGYAATISVVLLILIMTFTILQWQWGKEARTMSW